MNRLNVWILCLLPALGGCAAGPTVVGQWKAIEIPQDYLDRGVQTIQIDIRKDNTFAVQMFSGTRDLLNEFDGTWTYLEKNRIEFEMRQPPHEKGTGELLSDGRLETVGGSYTIYNQRIGP